MGSPYAGLLGVPGMLGGRGCINLGTITRSRPSTKIAPARHAMHLAPYGQVDYNICYSVMGCSRLLDTLPAI